MQLYASNNSKRFSMICDIRDTKKVNKSLKTFNHYPESLALSDVLLSHVVVFTIFSKCVTMTPIFQSTTNRLHFFSIFDLCSFALIINRVNGDGAKKCEDSLDGLSKNNLTFISVRGLSKSLLPVCFEYMGMGLWGLITAGRGSFGLRKQCQCHLFS